MAKKQKNKKLNKKKKGYVIGCVALSVLLAASTYITVVVIGVVAEENKKGTLIGTPDPTAPTTENDVAYENGYIQYQNPDTNANATDNNQTVTANNNTNGNGAGAQNTITPDIPEERPVNTLLNVNKTKADIIKIYADVMDNTKKKAPGFTKVEYQELPDGEDNRVFSEGGDKAGDEAVAKMLNFVQSVGVFVPKEEAEANPYIHEKGDADMARFPVFDREKGSYLTDPNSIESYTYEVLPNGNVKMHFVLVSEDNPEPISENTNIAPSYTGAVFSPMSKAKIDGTVYHPIVTVFAKDIKYSLRYHDCSVDVEFNPNTLEIAHLEQIARVSIKGSGNVVGLGKIGLERQELIGTVICKDFKY